MTDFEKEMLSMLKNLNDKFETMETNQATMATEQATLSDKFEAMATNQATMAANQAKFEAEVRQEFTNVKQDNLRTNILMEEIKNDVRIIAEGHQNLHDKFDELAKLYVTKEELELEVKQELKILSRAVDRNCVDIEELKKLKTAK